MNHHCHARGCKISTHPRMLMCIRHWRMVPLKIQREVWAAYTPGQERTKQFTESYSKAFDRAVNAVYEFEKGSGICPKCGWIGLVHKDGGNGVRECPTIRNPRKTA